MAAELAAGRLVAPFSKIVSTGQRHYVVCQAARRHEPAIARFLSWLRMQAETAER